MSNTVELSGCSCQIIFKDGKARSDEEMLASLINTDDYKMICVCDIPTRVYSTREKPSTLSGVVQTPHFTADSSREHFGMQGCDTCGFSLWHVVLLFIFLIVIAVFLSWDKVKNISLGSGFDSGFGSGST